MSWHMSPRYGRVILVMAILFWLLSIDHIVNVQYKRCGFAKTRLRHPSLPFDSLPYPTRTICRRVRSVNHVTTKRKKADHIPEGVRQESYSTLHITHDSVRQWNTLSFSCDVIIRMRWRAVNIMEACFRTLKENQASFFQEFYASLRSFCRERCFWD